MAPVSYAVINANPHPSAGGARVGISTGVGGYHVPGGGAFVRILR